MLLLPFLLSEMREADAGREGGKEVVPARKGKTPKKTPGKTPKPFPEKSTEQTLIRATHKAGKGPHRGRACRDEHRDAPWPCWPPPIHR